MKIREKINKRAFIRIILAVIFTIIIIWFSGFDVRNFVSIGEYVFTDEMRTNTSVYYSLASNRLDVSAPTFSFLDRKFYKYSSASIVPFTLKMPKNIQFDEAVVNIAFKPLEDVDIDVEALRADSTYLPKRLFSSDLDVPRSFIGYKPVIYTDHTVFQKGLLLAGKGDLADEIVALSKGKRLKIYTDDLDLKKKLFRVDFAPDAHQVVPVSLKGKNTLVTYTDGRPIVVDIAYQDNNQHDGPDRINIRIKQGSHIFSYVQSPDDGNETSNEVVGKDRTVHIELNDPSPGVYEIELDNSNDIVTRSVSINSQYLLGVGTIHVDSQKETPIYFAGGRLNVKSYTSASENGSYFVPSHIDQQNGVEKLDLPASDLEMSLEENQYISFTEDTFLDLGKIEFVQRAHRATADLIITQNDKASQRDRNGWITANVIFSREQIFVQNNQLALRLNIHGDIPLILLDAISVKLR